MFLGALVFCFLQLPILNLEAFKVGDEGVCVATISVPKTRIKLVRLNKWCGKKKCVVKRTEAYKETVEKAVCCNGWEYSVDRDVCTPICRTGCKGGHCIAPEVCHCDPPSTLDLVHKNTCIKPQCDPPCFNSDCIDNSCLCHEGYTKFNTTHCHKCDPGYLMKEEYDCLPICNNCTNGKCTAPEVCTCNEGYTFRNNSCQPVCNDCVNATCVAPNKCSCFEGYKKFNETHCHKCDPGYFMNEEFDCLPICNNCTNGKCTAPEVCTCNEGYTLQNNSCQPVCNDCVNATCVAPNTCACFEGYKKFNATHCHKCDPGYLMNEEFDCVPICNNCTNGKCTAPEVCTCNEGYTFRNNSCHPVCNDCVNATCVAPNKCSCLEGYKKLNDSTCVPKCDDCEGECVEPNVCKCRDGVSVNGTCRVCECGQCMIANRYVNFTDSTGADCACNSAETTHGCQPYSCDSRKMCKRCKVNNFR